jgi:hypothetical protein
LMNLLHKFGSVSSLRSGWQTHWIDSQQK